MDKSDNRKLLQGPILVICILLLAVHCYWWSFPIFHDNGLVNSVISDFFLRLNGLGIFDNPYYIKAFILLFIICAFILKAGKPIQTPWWQLIVLTVISIFVFFFPPLNSFANLLTSVTGFFLCLLAVNLVGRKIGGFDSSLNDMDETFDQCRKKITNDYSVNIPYRFRYHHRWHKGWINLIALARGTIIMGTPGSGKTFSVYLPIIEQSIKRGYTGLCYDYKFPDLTEEIYNNYILNKKNLKDKYHKDFGFYVVNFDDPRYSHRCNPIHPDYLKDPADSTEIAELIMANVNKGSDKKGEFFSESAKSWIDMLIWQLKVFEHGRYCTFPHLIELMGRDYRWVLQVIEHYPELDVKRNTFADAMKDKAYEQLQGQIASARIPLNKFNSPALAWVLSGNDFMLDVNNPDEPKYVCIGNNPIRQNIYGTALALITARFFPLNNQKGRLPSFVLLDEMPTVYLKDVDNTIATARSNKVCLCMGVQDKSQLIRDYRREEADVLLNTVGNILSGQVNGMTAKEMSEMFGREYRQMQSVSEGESSSVTRSFQQAELLSQSKIETLSSGVFFGRVADLNKQKIDKKLFCGEIKINMRRYKRRHNKKNWKKIPSVMELQAEERRRRGEKAVVVDHFGLKRIEDNIRKEPKEYIIEYLIQQKFKEERNMVMLDRDYEMMTDGAADLLVRKTEYPSLTDEQKEGLLPEVIKYFQDKAVDDAVMANYEAIKKDIDRLFEVENVNEQTVAAAKEENKNGQNKPKPEEAEYQPSAFENDESEEVDNGSETDTSEDGVDDDLL